MQSKPFLSDVMTLRERARLNIGDGSVTHSYQGRWPSASTSWADNRISIPGDLRRAQRPSKAQRKENLIAERNAVEHHRELIRHFGDRDPATRRMLESILSVEEEHANDMHDLLVAHEGKPMLSK